jgi:Sugar (and other) transporter
LVAAVTGEGDLLRLPFSGLAIRYGTFWCFSAGALLTIIMVGLLVPESKGRSLEEITDIWARPAENEAVG